MSQPQPTDHHDLLPLLLVLGSPTVSVIFGDRFAQRFRILKHSDSSLPFDQFLASPPVRSATAILCAGGIQISADLLSQLPSVRLVVTASAGVNHIDVPECRRRGIAVTNAGDSLTEDVADMAVGLLIDVLRKMSAADRYVRGGSWVAHGNFPLAHKLGAKRVGIVGLGRIGSEVAKRLEAFGCKISYNSRTKKDSVSYRFYNNICELANDNEVLIICCSLNNQTRHMIDRRVMCALGKDGVIINVGRGEIIKEKELVECLVGGEIGGAGLDVFEDEPNVPQELIGLDNVVLSPHWGVFTLESFEALFQVTVGNLDAFFSNNPLHFQVLQN
ncbi:hypothetical protein CsatA_020868 [Cannabis sativa]